MRQILDKSVNQGLFLANVRKLKLAVDVGFVTRLRQGGAGERVERPEEPGMIRRGTAEPAKNAATATIWSDCHDSGPESSVVSSEAMGDDLLERFVLLSASAQGNLTAQMGAVTRRFFDGGVGTRELQDRSGSCFG